MIKFKNMNFKKEKEEEEMNLDESPKYELNSQIHNLNPRPRVNQETQFNVEI
jgi:hypothetical protein